MALWLGMGQLAAAVATLTFVHVSGIESLLGLGPAILLLTGALAAVPAGRAMDHIGRIPVLVAGFLLGATGAALTGLWAIDRSTALVTVGFVLVGVGNGSALLTRTAAGDMYPPERRARGIALVLFGSVFGAILGPTVFTPLFHHEHVEGRTLGIAWFVAAAMMVAAAGVVAAVRPDPKRIAERLARDRADTAPSPPAESLSRVVRRPGVLPALLAALASFAVMVGVMNLAGYVVVAHGHHEHEVFPIVSAHILGMYALVLVVGSVIDAVGRARALVGGLLVIAVSTLSLLWVESVAATAASLFVLGIGWNVSFVAATTELVDLSSPSERGRLLGLSDLLSGLVGAALVLAGGYAFSEAGVAGISLGATAIALAPSLWFLLRGRAARPAVEAA